VKLEAVELRRIRMSLVAPFETSFGVQSERDILIVKAITDGGEGWGECVAGEEPDYSSEYVEAAQHELLFADKPVDDDAERALSFVKSFGSVTVLNGHIHQIMQKIEGKVSFHTAMSTAFPQPAPGTAPSAGPMKVPADQLQKVLGITDVNYMVSGGSLAIVDSPLDGSTTSSSGK